MMSRRPAVAAALPPATVASWMPHIASQMPPASPYNNMLPPHMMQAPYAQQQQQPMYQHLAAPMPSVVDFGPGVIPNLQQVVDQNAYSPQMPSQPTNMNEQIFHRERVRTAVHQAVSAGINDYEKRHKSDISNLKSELSTMRSRERQLQRKINSEMGDIPGESGAGFDDDMNNDDGYYQGQQNGMNSSRMTGRNAYNTRSARRNNTEAPKNVASGFKDRERRYEVARAIYETAKEERNAGLHM
jgi:hypothetical protein